MKENRVIKFRAWDDDRKQMVYDFFEDQPWGYVLSFNDEFEIFCYNHLENGDYQECELMQYTGLKDRNSKEIYEGDICRFYNDEDDTIPFVGTAYMNNNRVGGEWEIITCDNEEGEDSLDSTSFWNDDFEIIGNIYENPELLTQQLNSRKQI